MTPILPIENEMKLEQPEELKEVSIEKILINQFQPRRHFCQEELKELAASIRAVGLIHPPTVRPSEDGMMYEIIAGERRFRAAQLAGMNKIPVIIRHTAHHLSAEAALIENIQRVDLNPMEIAKALRKLMEQFGLHQEALALRIGKKRSTVANYLRLLALPKNIQESLFSNAITMGHAKAILSLDSEDRQNLLHELILRDNLNVRQVEEIAKRMSEKGKKSLDKDNEIEKEIDKVEDVHLKFLAERMQERLGTKVVIHGKGEQGKVSIDYYNLDDLDRVLRILGLDLS